ncbi:MAG: hypothetical protein KJO06_08110, partial [Gemmatimonadetes bacterium]|nr:hypothetical protein [Gemmatimonadota bacterium]
VFLYAIGFDDGERLLNGHGVSFASCSWTVVKKMTATERPLGRRPTGSDYREFASHPFGKVSTHPQKMT